MRKLATFLTVITLVATLGSVAYADSEILTVFSGTKGYPVALHDTNTAGYTYTYWNKATITYDGSSKMTFESLKLYDGDIDPGSTGQYGIGYIINSADGESKYIDDFAGLDIEGKDWLLDNINYTATYKPNYEPTIQMDIWAGSQMEGGTTYKNTDYVHYEGD
jgi:hypothetical protein